MRRSRREERRGESKVKPEQEWKGWVRSWGNGDKDWIGGRRTGGRADKIGSFQGHHLTGLTWATCIYLYLQNYKISCS